MTKTKLFLTAGCTLALVTYASAQFTPPQIQSQINSYFYMGADTTGPEANAVLQNMNVSYVPILSLGTGVFTALYEPVNQLTSPYGMLSGALVGTSGAALGLLNTANTIGAPWTWNTNPLSVGNGDINLFQSWSTVPSTNPLLNISAATTFSGGTANSINNLGAFVQGTVGAGDQFYEYLVDSELYNHAAASLLSQNVALTGRGWKKGASEVGSTWGIYADCIDATGASESGTYAGCNGLETDIHAGAGADTNDERHGLNVTAYSYNNVAGTHVGSLIFAGAGDNIVTVDNLFLVEPTVGAKYNVGINLTGVTWAGNVFQSPGFAVDQYGDITSVGSITSLGVFSFTNATLPQGLIESGGATSPVGLELGRTAEDFVVGVAGAGGNFSTLSAQGDGVISAVTGQLIVNGKTNIQFSTGVGGSDVARLDFNATTSGRWTFDNPVTLAGPTILGTYAIGGLPSCAASILGSIAVVSNGTAYGTGTYGSAVSATGAVSRKVLCTNTAGPTTYAWAYD